MNGATNRPGRFNGREGRDKLIMESIETLQFELSQIQVVKKKSTFDVDSDENQSASVDKHAKVKGMKSTKRNLIYRQIEEEEGSGDDSDSEIITKKQMKKKDKMSEKP